MRPRQTIERVAVTLGEVEKLLPYLYGHPLSPADARPIREEIVEKLRQSIAEVHALREKGLRVEQARALAAEASLTRALEAVLQNLQLTQIQEMLEKAKERVAEVGRDS